MSGAKKKQGPAFPTAPSGLAALERERGKSIVSELATPPPAPESSGAMRAAPAGTKRQRAPKVEADFTRVVVSLPTSTYREMGRRKFETGESYAHIVECGVCMFLGLPMPDAAKTEGS